MHMDVRQRRLLVKLLHLLAVIRRSAPLLCRFSGMLVLGPPAFRSQTVPIPKYGLRRYSWLTGPHPCA